MAIMTNDDMPPRPRPWWIKIIIIAVALPVLALPLMLEKAPANGQADGFLLFYPIYVVAAAICEWICWPRRPEITWILVALMVLTHAARWALVLNPLP